MSRRFVCLLFVGLLFAELRPHSTLLANDAVAPQAAAKVTISIDAGQVGAPISKYVYGQFIEHLGRCIYGGIWAEMLEDRKFFYPVGKDQSPWKVVGPADAATMVREGAFVGEHSPQITLAGDRLRGIVQEGLGLVAGKTYGGRAWLRRSKAGAVQVSLVWGDAAGDRQTVTIPNVGNEFARTPLEFTAARGTTSGRLEIRAEGEGTLAVGAVSLMPADNVRGMRADTLALLKDLDAPVYRWPGGNFVSGYNWRDGLGDMDHRPPRKNPAWKGVEPNDFGIDEYMTFCRLLETDPYITVNSGLGVVQTAVDELQYANAAATTPMGTLRAENGHAEPYRARFWSIGNEMYGSWQLGHMPLEKYVQKHNAFAEAMRAVDPSITLVAVGDVGPWSEGMLKSCAGHMDLMSEHFYCRSKPDLAAHVRQVPDQVRHKVAAHREYRKRFDSLQGKDIRIALDEWNYWYGPEVFGQLGSRYFLKDALGIAAGLNEMARNSDMIFMANYAQTVNVIGCIKTSKTAASLETTGLVLKLYRKHFGVLPVATESRALNSMAALSRDGKTLTVAVVNPSLKTVPIELAVKGISLGEDATRWQIAGNDPRAFNDPGKPPAVNIDVATVQAADGKLSVAPCSVTLFALPTK